MAEEFEKKPGLGRRIVQAAGKAVRAVVREAAQLDFFARFKGQSAGGAQIDFPIDVGRETVWATQGQMADLFGVDQSVVSRHIKNIFDSNELADDEATHAKFALVRSEGGRDVSRDVSHYSLDVILTVGYRVSGSRAAEFRKWANGVLKGYIEEGYALNGERLKNDPAALAGLAQKVRELRTSEKNLYARVRDTFVACSCDYDVNSLEARRFFACTQDHFHFAVSEQTAAQIVLSRADGTKHNMGMTALGNRAPTLADAKIAKNYMTPDELRQMENLGEQWLLYAEGMAIRGNKVSMTRLEKKLGEIVQVNEYSLFPGYATVNSSRPAADEHARRQLEIYRRSLPRSA